MFASGSAPTVLMPRELRNYTDLGLSQVVMSAEFYDDACILLQLEMQSARWHLNCIDLETNEEADAGLFPDKIVDIIQFKKTLFLLIGNNHVGIFASMVEQDSIIKIYHQPEVTILKRQVVGNKLYLLIENEIEMQRQLIVITLEKKITTSVIQLEGFVLDTLLVADFCVAENNNTLVLFLYDEQHGVHSARMARVVVSQIGVDGRLTAKYFAQTERVHTISGVQLSKDQKHVLFAQPETGQIKILALANKKIATLRLKQLAVKWPNASITELKFLLANNQRFIVVYHPKAQDLYLYDIKTCAVLKRLHLTQKDDIVNVKFSPNSQTLLVMQQCIVCYFDLADIAL